MKYIFLDVDGVLNNARTMAVSPKEGLTKKDVEKAIGVLNGQLVTISN